MVGGGGELKNGKMRENQRAVKREKVVIGWGKAGEKKKTEIYENGKR